MSSVESLNAEVRAAMEVVGRQAKTARGDQSGRARKLAKVEKGVIEAAKERKKKKRIGERVEECMWGDSSVMLGFNGKHVAALERFFRREDEVEKEAGECRGGLAREYNENLGKLSAAQEKVEQLDEELAKRREGDPVTTGEEASRIAEAVRERWNEPGMRRRTLRGLSGQR